MIRDRLAQAVADIRAHVHSAAPATRTTSFDYDYDTALQAWVGVTCCNGLGIRARYFRLDQDANPSYDRNMVQRLVAAGAEVGAMTPGELAGWIASKIKR